LWQNNLALDFTHSQIAYVGYEGTIFHLSGPFAPLLGAQSGVVMKDISGIDPPFKMLDNKGARQDGTTWYDALYDPGTINMSVDIGGINAADFRSVMRAWWGAWDPKQVGKLCWFSPERGEWWALARLSKPVPNNFKQDFYQSWLANFTWTIQNDNAFWFGPPSVCQVSTNSQVNLADTFTASYDSGLGPNWTEITSGPGQIAALGGGSATGVPVTLDASGAGTVGRSTGTGSILTATCTYTCGAASNYVVATVTFLAGLQPNSMTVLYGTTTMTFLGTAVTGIGGVAYFALAAPPLTLKTVTATLQSFGNVLGMTVNCTSFVGWGSTVFTSGGGGEGSSPSQIVQNAFYGDLVLWAVANVSGSNVPTALNGFNQTQLQNTGNISLPLQDSLSMLLGYEIGSASGSSVSFSANVAQANIDQWWSAAALTLLPTNPSLTPPLAGRAAWVPSGSTTGTAIAQWLASTSTSDDQIISLVVDGNMPRSTDTVQTLTLNSPVVNGTFTVTSGGNTTQPIVYGASASTVELELEALSSILVGNVSVTAAEGGTFDAVGAGFAGNNANPSYTHTIGTKATTLVAFITVFTNTPIPTVTAFCGGAGGFLMTLQGAVEAYATDGAGGYASLFAFVLENPPTGAQTMLFQIGGATVFEVSVNSISYNLVTLAGFATQAQATSANPSMTQPLVTPGQIVCQAFGGYQNAMSAYTQTSRYATTFSAGNNLSFVMGEGRTTAGSVAFAATMSAGPWSGISIPLYSPMQTYTATFVGAMGNIVVPTMTGTTSWNGSSGITITSLQAGAASFIDLWGRMNNTGTLGLDGVRARFGYNTAALSIFNNGTEYDVWSGTCNGPNIGDQLSLQCGVVSPSQAQLDQLLYGANYTADQYQVFQNGFPLIPFGNVPTVLQQWFGGNYGFTDITGHSLAGPPYRSAGLGMSAGGNGTNQVPPPPVSQFNAGAGTPFLTLTNIGDQPGFPSYLCYGPGTFLINDPGTNNMISFGPLLPGQIAMLNTNPRLAPVVDLTPPSISAPQLNLFQQLNAASTAFMQYLVDLVTNNNLPPLLQEWQSIFGQTPPQGPLTSLLSSRFTQPVLPMLEQQGPVTTHIPCQIQGGNDQSKNVASLTPMRRWPE
jgi:hypothetical protein